VKKVPAGVAAIVGGFISLATVDLRDRLGIVIGALAGVAAGAIADQIITNRQLQHGDDEQTAVSQ
jgi:hypothetical protein